ncbi:Ornithine decarboxylase [Araneus ventricosus]|uniref:Ornithine decarboxylase n=1 Tax=Araneus ventricosus TaxID=182803 RepID=A0A4Y2HXP8_ARAVE|nr:Ornithine decarboxylase [Araneus ventricosus]
MILDIDDVFEKVKNWKEKMPRVDIYYAMKCNTDRVLLQTLAALNVGFDCASQFEIETILSLGVSADRIVYANTCKGFSHLRRAADLKVEMMTFDSESELIKIKQLCPSAKLLLRLYVCAVSGKLRMNQKFGCDESEVPCLLEAALKHNLSVIGVSFHIGCRIQDPDEYATAIAMCRQTFDIAEKKGIIMYVLDIGGGFPGFIISRNHSTETSFSDIARAVNQAIEKHFPPDGALKIIAEPGRYIVSSAFTLCSKIIGKKRRFVDNEEDIIYIINEGVYGLFLNTIFHRVRPVIKEMSPSSNTKRSSIWGQSCDPIDLIMKKCMLPELHVGDWIVFEEMGAYTTACSTTFNGFEKTRVKRVASRRTLSELEKIAGSKLSQILHAEVHLKESENK